MARYHPMARAAFALPVLLFATPMFFQIASFLLDVVGGLLTGACLLRLYMQWQRVPFSNPVGGLVFALTDWLIMPLRRVIPLRGVGMCPVWWQRCWCSWCSTRC